jgi:hypothetical protein
MAAGFEESYIRLWNLKGESLNGMQSEFQLNNIRDCAIFHQTVARHSLIAKLQPPPSTLFERKEDHLLANSSDTVGQSMLLRSIL